MSNDKPTVTMTCQDLGGPCEQVHTADDPNDIIKAQDRRLKDAVAAGRVDHEAALKDMKSRWRRPISGLKWYNQVKSDFATVARG